MPRTKDLILAQMDPSKPETIQALIDFHRSTLGGFFMEADDDKGGNGQDGDKGTKDGNDKGGGASKAGGKSGDSDKDDLDDKDLGEAGKKAIKAERDARKALETEIRDFKAAQADQARKLAEALGIETKDAKSSDDVLDTLKAEVTELRLDRLVDKIARDAKVTDEDDIALIRAAGNEDAMRKLAGRLAPKDNESGDDKSGDDKKRRFPQPDRSLGQGGGDTGRATSIRQVQADRAAAREAKNKS